jgi:hypothetical protein
LKSLLAVQMHPYPRLLNKVQPHSATPFESIYRSASTATGDRP